MAKYIHKQAAIHALVNEANIHNNPLKRAYTRAAAIIEQITAEDVQPIKHGRWEYYKNNGIFDTYKCTLCGEKYEIYMDIEPTTIYKYCPNCGARMDDDETIKG